MILKLCYYPDPFLRREIKPINDFQADKLNSVFQDMVETLNFHKGIGLASTQVGIDLPLFILQHDKLMTQPRIFINPQIISGVGTDTMEEGCLSFPGLYLKIKRPLKIKFKYCTLEGNEKEEVFDGLLARAVLHETDHLQGILFIDRISQTQRYLIKRELKRIEEKYGRTKC